MDALLGVSAGDWWRLLRENHFAVSPRYYGRAMVVGVLSLRTSFFARTERKLYESTVQNVNVKPPVFVLGHWRNGTTLLHNLLSLDDQFAYPNLYQISHPHTCLINESYAVRALSGVATHKRPMDNMEIAFDSPGEDEGAMAVMSLRSPLIAWSFPRREEHYDRYLTFRGVPQEEVEQWKESFLVFLKKLTWRYGRPLLLKSPTHTGRIRLLLEMFPDAKFIHVHRNPYVVFSSTQRLYEKAVVNAYLQQPRFDLINDGILRRYKMMYDAFFEERTLIPEGNYREVCFEDFERDTLDHMENIYNSLNISGYQKSKPKLEKYLNSIANYKKNTHPSLEEGMRCKIAQTWHRCFEEWGYDD